MTWDVWKVYYMTYAQIEQYGDKQRERVARGLSFEEAKKTVDRLGSGQGDGHVYGHSMCPAQK